jgi:hypothetical protein
MGLHYITSFRNDLLFNTVYFCTFWYVWASSGHCLLVALHVAKLLLSTTERKHGESCKKKITILKLLLVGVSSDVLCGVEGTCERSGLSFTCVFHLFSLRPTLLYEMNRKSNLLGNFLIFLKYK